jgi:hypothetical protein
MTRTTRNTQSTPVETLDSDDWGTIEVAASRGRGGGSSETCAISVINDGRVLIFYPSAAISTMMEEGWSRGAKVAFRYDAENTIKAVKLTPADGGGGLNIRRYRSQNPCVHIRIPSGLVARTTASGKQACEHRVEGDAVLIRVPPGISFEAAE